ncbi:MAG: 3-deoxy-7-phosphoheptulonate synthase, partial [Muribaculaceae bacterium]|nr:3-deoxy-7-phosphoheptulonate synthase [Muribaculaceae bacterium]
MNDIQKITFNDIELNRPVVIAGPCSAESREQVLSTAADLYKYGVRIFRAGVWKPRTKPGGFEGVGAPALEWLAEVKEQYGMKTATEVANAAHIEAAIKSGIDLIWIGARTSANPFAMQEIADCLSDYK